MKEKAYVRLRPKGGLPQKHRKRQKVVTMDPDLLETFISLFCKLGFKISDPLGKLLVQALEMTPQMLMFIVCQMGQVSLIEGFEVVKECLHHVLIEVVVGKKLCHSHEDGVAILGGKEL